MCREDNVGVFPFLRMPIHNYETLIFYVDIWFPCGAAARRAWLQPFRADGDRAVVKLETTRQNLGLGGPAPRAQIQTSETAMGEWIYSDMACWFSTDSVAGTFLLGLTEESSTGILTASIPPETFASSTASSFYLQSNRKPKCGVVSTPHNCLDESCALMTGSRLSATTETDRVLRALPKHGRFGDGNRRRNRNRRRHADDLSDEDEGEPSYSAFGSEFYLAWREPASTEGYPVTIRLVSQLCSIPCSREEEEYGRSSLRNEVDFGPLPSPFRVPCCQPLTSAVPINYLNAQKVVNLGGGGGLGSSGGGSGVGLIGFDAGSPSCCSHSCNRRPSKRCGPRRHSAFSGSPGYFI